MSAGVRARGVIIVNGHLAVGHSAVVLVEQRELLTQGQYWFKTIRRVRHEGCANAVAMRQRPFYEPVEIRVGSMNFLKCQALTCVFTGASTGSAKFRTPLICPGLMMCQSPP